MIESRLILHCGAREVTRDELDAVPTPAATAHASLTMRLGGLFDQTFNVKPLVLNGDTNGDGGPDHGTAA